MPRLTDGEGSLIQEGDQRPYADILRAYQTLVATKHGNAVQTWPLLNGWKLVQGSFRGWTVVLLQDDPFVMVTHFSSLGEIKEALVGFPSLDARNVEEGRRRLEGYFSPGGRDALLLIPPDGRINAEFDYMMNRHERAQGLTPMKVFLSHKGADKPRMSTPE